MSRYVIGITGGIACGKTNLTDALAAEGARVIDADVISRSLTAPGGKALDEIRKAFGEDCFDGDELDRRALAQRIFSSPQDKKRLEDILHPMIASEVASALEDADSIVFLSAPLLYECGYETLCDEVWCAYVPRKEQLRRLRKRDGLSVAEAEARLHSQWPAIRKARLADEVIRTDGTAEESAEKALCLYQSRKETHLAERSSQP